MFTRNPLRAQFPHTTTRQPHQLRLEFLEERTLLSGYARPTYVRLPLSGGGASPFGTGGPTGYTPAQIRHAYGFDQIIFPGNVPGDGAGTTIAIVDAFDNPKFVSSTSSNFNSSDLHLFDLQFGLPDPVFTKVNQSGGTNYPVGDTGWGDEIALDVEWAHAIAPKANILLVEATDNSYTNLLAAVRYAASQPGVVAVSMSFGGLEDSTITTLDSTFVTPSGHAGVTFIASSGDSGAPPEYPSTSPNVLSVGGTTLNLTDSNTIASETGWGNFTGSSGGGISAFESQPSYQVGLVVHNGNAIINPNGKRTTPDVAYDSDPLTGFPVYDSYSQGSAAPWVQFGGTSAAAPQWAALIAIADQGRALAGKAALDGRNDVLPMLYQLPATDFYDITTGSSTGSPRYSAGPAYDLVTGIGSPVANKLVADLVGVTAGAIVIRQTPTCTVLPALNSIQVTFNQPVQVGTFAATQITAFTGPGNPGGFTVTPVSPANGLATTFTIGFTNALTAAGSYSLHIGPNILDANSHAMDQNLNGIPGEAGDYYTATFALASPAVVSSTPTGTQAPGVTKVHVTFNEPILISSFTTGQITAFTRGSTSILEDITGIVATNPNGSTATDFDITLKGLGEYLAGSYSMTLGPNITDAFGNPMAAAYTGTFTIVVTPPAVTAFSPTGNQPPPIPKVHVTFNQAVLISSFTTSQIAAFTRGSTSLLGDITGVIPINGNGSTATDFDITFNGVGEYLAGSYSMTLGPNITDAFGNPMAAAYTGTFTIVATPPAVTVFTPSGTNAPIQTQATVTFNVPILVSSFGVAQVHTFTRNGTSILGDITSVIPVGSTDGGKTAKQFTIAFASGLEKATGAYVMTIGPDITDQFNNSMTAAYTATFKIDGPKVTAVTPASTIIPVTGVTVTFSRAVDATTFTTSQITITGPGGSNVAIGSISPATGSATTFTVSFSTPQTVGGTYTTVIGPNIQDTFGNPLDQNGDFIPGQPGVAPAGDQFQSTFTLLTEAPNLLVNPGFETGSFSGWTIVPGWFFSWFGVGRSRPHSGNYAAYFGALFERDDIYQNVPTIPGHSYRISYWVANDGGGTTEIRSSWGGKVLEDLFPNNAFAYQQHTFDVMATSTSTQFRIGGYQGSAYWYLDDVSVTDTTTSHALRMVNGTDNANGNNSADAVLIVALPPRESITGPFLRGATVGSVAGTNEPRGQLVIDTRLTALDPSLSAIRSQAAMLGGSTRYQTHWVHGLADEPLGDLLSDELIVG